MTTAESGSWLDAVDTDRLEAVSVSLDLRRPNREALESIVWMSWHHFASGRPAPFEGVVDSATGVGKTYIIAATLEYFAGEGVRNFAVICPGRTILNKTVDNFTAGSSRSLLAGMEVEPVVVTAENFDTPAMRALMDDPDEVKLYVFTVQSLLRPTTKVGKRTHKFQEGLGSAFYARLQAADDLVIFADEAHTYWGKAFSEAVRELYPQIQIGLTATPHPRTPPEQIIYRYPLAQAIADRLVKTPVLVGRKDDLSDPETKLLDGIALLERKAQAIERFCQTSGAQPVAPLMLVVAQSIDEADELQTIIGGQSFAGGRYQDRVLTVHSEAADEALEALESVGGVDSPFRIVISVGMLKEGWDNKSVYVLASMRASVSTILTEQTLGRGLRLPFGRYTGIQLLDTLEVLGHERYEQLLRKAGVLNEEFVSYRTRLVFREDANGNLVPVIETEEVGSDITVSEDGSVPTAEASGLDVDISISQLTDSGSDGTAGSGAGDGALGAIAPGGPVIASIEDYASAADDELTHLQQELHPKQEVLVPRLRMTPVSVKFSLADITDLAPFTQLGQRIAADPVGELRRVTLSARTTKGPDGIWRTQMVTAPAVDRIESPGALLPLEAARSRLAQQVLAAPAVPARLQEAKALAPLLDAFIAGLGDKAEAVMSAYMDRAAAGFITLINTEQRRFSAKPQFDEVIELYALAPVRFSRRETDPDRMGKFKRGAGYDYQKSLYAQDWFDSAPERDVANLLDNGNDIVWWLRLQIGDLPILWAQGREYHPDFIACDQSGDHWVIEVKSDKDLPSAEVQAKREAAKRWANHVSADSAVPQLWKYLLVSEDHVRTAKASWTALKGLGE
jgi:type III restriction enzyme